MKFNDEFWRWFGNSVIVNPDGSPRIVYHGTLARTNFSTFALPNGVRTKTDLRPAELGIHVGTIDQANTFAYVSRIIDDTREVGARVYPLYASIQSPLRLTDNGSWTVENILRSKQFVAAGVWSAKRISEFKYFYANQIKRTYGDYGETEEEQREAAEVLENYMTNAMYDLRKDLTAAGYDGVVYLNVIEGDTAEDSYIVWNPAQLKSAIGNRGTWSLTDPDILHGINAFGGLTRR